MPDKLSINFELRAYLAKQNRPIPPRDVSKDLGISQQQLINDIDDMIDAGYHVEMHPYLGVRLFDIPDRVIPFEIRDGLNSKTIGQRVFAFATCVSTNDEAWSAIERGEAQDGDVFIAEHQSNARGRMGRSWSSVKGAGLYLSVVCKMKLPPDKLHYLTSSVSLAVANTIEQFVHLPAEIKWPNDVLIGGRKVCGVLVESRSNHPDTFVVGVGLNVNQRAEDFPESLQEIASSLRIERNMGPLHRIRILRPLLFYMDSVYLQLKKKKYERIAKMWKEFVRMIGSKVVVRCGADTHEGVLERLDLESGVGLRLADETLRTLAPLRVTSVSELRGERESQRAKRVNPE